MNVKGVNRFKRWCRASGQTVSQVSREIGDRGGQLAKWHGGRDTLPLGLLLALCNHTGRPLSEFASPSQMRVARELFAVMARDAAA